MDPYCYKHGIYDACTMGDVWWRRDRHDRKAWHPARDALRTMRRVVRPHLHPEDRADAARFPVAAGKYTAALVNGPHFHALNIATDTLESMLDELREEFGVLSQVSGNEWALDQHYGWYVIVYAPQAQAVAA